MTPIIPRQFEKVALERHASHTTNSTKVPPPRLSPKIEFCFFLNGQINDSDSSGDLLQRGPDIFEFYISIFLGNTMGGGPWLHFR